MGMNYLKSLLTNIYLIGTYIMFRSIKCQKLSNTTEVTEMNSVNLIINGSSDATTIKTIKNGTPKINDYQLEKMDCNEDDQPTEYNIMSPESINGHHKSHNSDGDYSTNGYHNGHSCDDLSNGTSRVSNNESGNEESMGVFSFIYLYIVSLII